MKILKQRALGKVNMATVYEFTIKHWWYPTENTKEKSNGPGELGNSVRVQHEAMLIPNW